MAALVVAIAVLGGGGALDNSADASVDIELAGNVNVDGARQQLISDAQRTWQATRVAEATDSDDEATVEFALPGTSLDGLIAELRRYPGATDVQVTMEVDPAQLAPEPLSDADSAPVEPVRLQVTLTRDKGGGPWVTILAAVVIALLALGALALMQRRSGDDRDDGFGGTGEYTPRTNLP